MTIRESQNAVVTPNRGRQSFRKRPTPKGRYGVTLWMTIALDLNFDPELLATAATALWNGSKSCSSGFFLSHSAHRSCNGEFAGSRGRGVGRRGTDTATASVTETFNFFLA